MGWTWLKRWIQRGQRKSRQGEDFKTAGNQSAPEGAATVGTTELLPSVFLEDYGYIPLVVVNAACVIENNIRVRGLFHTKGTASNVMRKLMTRCKSSRLKAVNVHDAVDALKTALASLHGPLLPDHVLEALICEPREGSSRHYVFVLREFRKCSPYNFAILHFVITLLSKVSKHTLENGADVQTLAAILVFDVIRPLIRERTDTEVNASYLIQRLPFLIDIMETFIENPEIFKMAATVGDDQLPEAGAGYHDAALLSAAEGSRKVDPLICSGISGSKYLRPVNIETLKAADIPGLNDSADAVDVLHLDRQGTADASAVVNHAEANTLGLKDVVTGTKGNMHYSLNLSTEGAAGPVVNNGGNPLTAADSERSANREGGIKISKFKSSPGKKPTRAPRQKKTAITRTQRNATNCRSKRLAKDVEEQRVSDSSLSSDFETLLLREVMSRWSENTRVSDDENSVMIQALKFPAELPSKTHTAQIPDCLVDCKTWAECTFDPPQRSPAEQESGTSNRQGSSNWILDNREPVSTTKDEETLQRLVTINPESKVLTVPRKRIKYRRKGKKIKRKSKKLVDVKIRSHFNSAGVCSVSPVPLQRTGAQPLVEATSKTSYATFVPSTEDKRISARTNVRDSNAAGSDDSSDLECCKSRHWAQYAAPKYLSNTRHSALSGSSGFCSRHSARCSALVCDNAARHSDNVCVSGCTRCSALVCDNAARHSDNVCVSGCTFCAKCAQSFASENDLEQSPRNKAGKGTRCLARLGNEVRARKRSPFVESTSCKIHTPTDLQQIIIVKVINERRRTFTRARVRGARKKSSVGAQRSENAAPKEGPSIGSLVEKIFVLSITLFIISLVLYHLRQHHSQEDRNE
ncbi:hypothetical protein BsWGS_13251 [Bradybaena similaris]